MFWNQIRWVWTYILVIYQISNRMGYSILSNLPVQLNRAFPCRDLTCICASSFLFESSQWFCDCYSISAPTTSMRLWLRNSNWAKHLGLGPTRVLWCCAACYDDLRKMRPPTSSQWSSTMTMRLLMTFEISWFAVASVCVAFSIKH